MASSLRQVQYTIQETDEITEFNMTQQFSSIPSPGGSDDDALGASSRISFSLNQTMDDGEKESSSLARTSLKNNILH